jgi:poly-gamma-glutamate synthesis protein (capsule biosynthesis protein)
VRLNLIILERKDIMVILTACRKWNKKRLFMVIACVILLISSALFFHARKRQTIILYFTGDILLDRGVMKYVEQYGYDYPFLKIKDTLKDGDIVCGNLEGPLTEGGIPSLKDPRYIFKFPPSIAQNLKDAGFNMLNLANNHTMDHGAKGLRDTMDTLNKCDIEWFGAGDNAEKARSPVFINIKGTVIGFIGYSAFPPEGYFYTSERPNISMLDESSLGESVAEARKKCDFLVVSFHWGREFDPYPDDIQKNAAHIAVDSGADIVIGHHPHVYQGVEEYNGKFIFYSLGNFIFDKQIPPGTDKGAAVKLYIQNGRLKNLDVLPVKITECQPEILEEHAQTHGKP